SDKFNVSADLNYRYNNSLTPVSEFNVINYMFHGSLWAVPKFPNGTYGLSQQGNNPLMYAELGGTSNQNLDYIAGNVKGEWNIINGLKFTTQLGYRLTFTYQKNFANSYTNVDTINKITKTVTNNTLTEVRNDVREYTLNNFLSYEKKLGKHHLKTLLGYSEIYNNLHSLTAYRERFYNNNIQSIGQGTNDGTKSNSGSDAEFGLRSFFGRVNYAFEDKFLFEANGRYDGSSRFTGNNQYSFFPSFSAGWRLSEEGFWDALKGTVNEFKLRGSWGKTGNQTIPLYSYFEALTASSYSFGGAPVTGYRPNTLANKDITWETTTQTDFGIDASLFKNFSISFDYYNKKTDGILLDLPIPGTIGLNAPPQNAGVVENKGIELTLGYRHGAGKRFRYDINGNLAINNNKVISLAGTGPYISGSDIDPRYVVKEGLPINAHWGYLTAGLFQTQEEISKYPTYTPNSKPGDVKYVDLNNDGKINADDMTMIGTSFPKYTFGLNSSFAYSNFEVSLLFQGAADVDTRLSGALAEMGNQEGFTSKIYTNNYWTPEHTNARFPRPVKFDLRNVATSDRLLIDGSYVRLKNIQLAYNLPLSVTKRFSMSRASVYVSGTNLFTISKLNEWNLDPEAESGRAVYYPQTSLLTFGVNLIF
ncbi:MAG: SusC/RagA family TonB-linked outer membrane protein, partial [Segetibacter sp.]